MVWSYPSATGPAPPGGFYFPDDAFFIRHGTAIISNQEENENFGTHAVDQMHTQWSQRARVGQRFDRVRGQFHLRAQHTCHLGNQRPAGQQWLSAIHDNARCR